MLTNETKAELRAMLRKWERERNLKLVTIHFDRKINHGEGWHLAVVDHTTGKSLDWLPTMTEDEAKYITEVGIEKAIE